MGRIHKTMTPAAEAANRANGSESGGPASDPGKERSKMNALKHGRFAERPDPVELLLAQPSPEEEAERQALRAELVERYQPPDAFAEQAAEELADLRFELLRLERVKQALWQRERELLELEQRRRARTVQHRVQEVTHGASKDGVKKRGLMQAPDSPAKFREMVVALEWLGVEMDRHHFSEARAPLVTLYGDRERSWRGERLMMLLRRCEEVAAEPESSPQAAVQLESYLVRFRYMVADELQEVREKLEMCELEQGPLSAAGQAVRLLEATGSRKWGWVRHQENFLRRSIDRKLRILIELRRDRAKAEKSLRGLVPASGGGQPQPPGSGSGAGAGRGESPRPHEAVDPDAANPSGAAQGQPPSVSTAGLKPRPSEAREDASEKTHRNRGTNPPCALESVNAMAALPVRHAGRSGIVEAGFSRAGKGNQNAGLKAAATRIAE